MKKTAIISAFPACGKTYFHEKGNEFEFTTLDSDSSKFSWILDENGDSTGVRNSDFPANYIQHIKNNIGKVDFIFVSSHDEVKQALEDHRLPYVLVMPDPKLKAEWIGRCWLRGSPDGFLNLIDKQWTDWTSINILKDKWKPLNTIFLPAGSYLSDVLWTLDSYRQ